MKTFFKPIADTKNTSEKSLETIELEKDITLFKLHNKSNDVLTLNHLIDRGDLLFYLCPEGESVFHFGPHYQLPLQEGKVMLLYNPTKDLPNHVQLEPKSKVAAIRVTVEKLHQLFLTDEEVLVFLNKENVNKKYYSIRDMTTMLLLTVNQLFNTNVNGFSTNLFFKAKGYEILSLYFSREESEDGIKNCPFLEDKNNVDKIRLTKKILIDRMANPPGIKELAREIGLNEYQLKVGFKNIYGATLFGFLNDYKMDHSRKMLDSGTFKVNEVAYSLGYQNPSHYITAFKKKYGITPKKYLMSSKLEINE